MDQETDAMKRHIDNERTRLTGNLREIESRFKNATDMRGKFNKNPLMGLGLAFAGGFLLSVIVDAGRSQSASSPAKASPLSKLSGTVDNIVEAFVGLASEKIESFIGDAVPGFQEQYKKLAG